MSLSERLALRTTEEGERARLAGTESERFVNLRLPVIHVDQNRSQREVRGLLVDYMPAEDAPHATRPLSHRRPTRADRDAFARNDEPSVCRANRVLNRLRLPPAIDENSVDSSRGCVVFRVIFSPFEDRQQVGEPVKKSSFRRLADEDAFERLKSPVVLREVAASLFRIGSIFNHAPRELVRPGDDDEV